MANEFDLLATELADLIASKSGPPMAKAMMAEKRPVQRTETHRPVYVHARPHPIEPKTVDQQVTGRRHKMLATADRVETMAKSLTDAGRLTGPERRLIAIQIEQLRRDAVGGSR